MGVFPLQNILSIISLQTCWHIALAKVPNTHEFRGLFWIETALWIEGEICFGKWHRLDLFLIEERVLGKVTTTSRGHWIVGLAQGMWGVNSSLILLAFRLGTSYGNIRSLTTLRRNRSWNRPELALTFEDPLLHRMVNFHILRESISASYWVNKFIFFILRTHLGSCRVSPPCS